MANRLPQMLPPAALAASDQPAASDPALAPVFSAPSSAAASPAPRSLTIRMNDSVWRDDPKEDSAHWSFVTRECRIACPPTVTEFYRCVERRLGLQSDTVRRATVCHIRRCRCHVTRRERTQLQVTCSIADNGEALRESNYAQQKSETTVSVKLKQPGMLALPLDLHSRSARVRLC